ncbi:unnamed protein product, partial [Phaeothamnion confervicola]
SVHDIVRGLHRKFSFPDTSAALANAGPEAGRDALGWLDAAPMPTPAVREAVVLATGFVDAVAADGSACAWEFLGLGGMAAIDIVLRNLARAGLERVVVVLARRGAVIRHVVEASAVSGRLWIEFADLGEAFSGTDVDALLSVR